MKALDEYFLSVAFTLLLNRVNVFANFMFSWTEQHGSERVRYHLYSITIQLTTTQYLRWSAGLQASANLSFMSSKSLLPNPKVPRLVKKFSAMWIIGWFDSLLISSGEGLATLEVGDSTGSTCSTVMATPLSLMLSLMVSGEGSSRAAIPARPGLVEESFLGRLPGVLPEYDKENETLKVDEMLQWLNCRS